MMGDSDLIRRQDAIEVARKYLLDNYITDADWHADGIESEIKSLPSAETPTVSEKHQLSKETSTNTSTDLISRQDAVKPFCVTPDGTRIPEVDCDNFPVEFSIEFIKKHLLSLPSAEPPHQYSQAYVEQIRTERDYLQDMVNEMASPKTGEWIQKDMCADRFCSECNYAVWDSEAEEYNFCPSCGARMLEEGGEA